MRDGNVIPLLVPPFSEFLALRVQELERERVALRRRVSTLERSRDLWRTRAIRKAVRRAA